MHRLVAALALATVAACGGGDDDSPLAEPTLTSPTTSASPSAEDDEKELRKLATDWYEARQELTFELRPDLSVLPLYLTGDYARSFGRNLRKARADGFIAKPDPQGRSRHRVESVQVTTDEAELVECIVNGDLFTRISDGAILNDEVETARLVVSADRTDEGWRLSNADETQTWEGVSGCAV